MRLWSGGRKKQFDKASDQARQALLQSGASEKDIQYVLRTLQNKVNEVPLPRIAIIGFTGVGKSTTLNALFNAGRPTSDIRDCTQEEAPVIGKVDKYTGSNGSVIIYDMPGLGEDMYTDQKHFATYRKVLPEVDVAIWTFHTGDRAMTPMQEALKGLIKYLGPDFQKKLMFAVNKADAIPPGESDWNQRLNAPSNAQRKNIMELESYIKEKIRQVMPEWRGALVTYSAKQRFHLEQLMEAMIETMPKERRWVMDSVANVADPTEMMDPQFLEYVRSQKKRM